MEKITIKNLYDLDKTISKDIFEGKEYPWEVLSEIKDFIIKLGNTLPEDKFDKIGDDVWIAKSAKVYPSAYISGPCIIDEEAEIRHCAFIRGSVIVGKKAVVGNSTEVKNSIIFDSTKVPHFNYVGDSILGYNINLGAGSITGNEKSDKTRVKIRTSESFVETNMKKVGAMIGDNVYIGCNAVLAPGVIIGKNSIVYPTNMIRGIIPENKIYKGPENIVERRVED